VVDEPGEDVAHAALPALVAIQTGHDAALDDAAHPFHFGDDVGVRWVDMEHDSLYAPTFMTTLTTFSLKRKGIPLAPRYAWR
jgi:hypothetical protein